MKPFFFQWDDKIFSDMPFEMPAAIFAQEVTPAIRRPATIDDNRGSNKLHAAKFPGFAHRADFPMSPSQPASKKVKRRYAENDDCYFSQKSHG